MGYPFDLPDLGYAHDALEPHIDARTMEIHHGKHHAGYTSKLNAALEELTKATALQACAYHFLLLLLPLCKRSDASILRPPEVGSWDRLGWVTGLVQHMAIDPQTLLRS